MLFKNSNLLRRTFAHFSKKKYVRNFEERLEENVKRIKHKETLKDIKDFQQYLDKKVKTNTLANTVVKTTKHDNKFKSFITDFRKKHPQYPNIIDMTEAHDMKPDSPEGIQKRK
jgi:hypothetical protein